MDEKILPLKEALVWGVEKKIGEKIIGLPTLGLGDIIGGLRTDDFVIVTARGGTGKTALMLQIAYDLSTKKEPTAVGFLSGEMSVEDLAESRLMKLHPKTREIAINASPGDKIEKIMALDDVPLYFPIIEERWPFTSKCIPVMDYMRTELGVKAFFLDHMKFFLNADPLATRSDERQVIEQTVLDMRLYAKKYKTPIFLAVQPKQIAADEEVTSDSLKGTSAIGQDASVTIVLDRPRLKPKKGQEDDRTTVFADYVNLKVEKARHGKGNVSVKLQLNEKTFRLEPYEPPTADLATQAQAYRD